MRLFHNLSKARKPKSWIAVRDYKPRAEIRADRSAARPTVQQRFEDKFVPDPNSGCWLWTASVGGGGYGKFGGKGRTPQDAHRASWQMYRGEIPAGLMVLHRCDVRCCVNPNHLFLGTAKENTHDMMAKGRYTPWNRGITHCKQGHEFSPENTVYVKGGKARACRKCKADFARKYRQADPQLYRDRALRYFAANRDKINEKKRTARAGVVSP